LLDCSRASLPYEERILAMRMAFPEFAAKISDELAFGLAKGSKGRATPMKSEEACVGKRVRVREDHSMSNLRGREGTIFQRWGNPSYAALDVLLDEGEWLLFWYHELEESDKD
jgi:hypothetical protein